MDKERLPTPSLVVNLEVLQRNLHVMATFARQAGVKLRPHIKTHKNQPIAQMQMQAGAVGITCATISEAEVMAAAGIKDIFVAYPIIGDYQLSRAVQLNKECRLTLAFDSFAAAERLNRCAADHEMLFNLSMIINTGQDRDGVLHTEARRLGEEIGGLSNLNLTGVMTHEGHVHQAASTAVMRQLAFEAGQKLVWAAEGLRQAGFNISTVSSGTTPACQAQVKVEGVTEWRPGTYVFNDLSQMKFLAEAEDCALTVLATVVSNPDPERYILDAGSKVLSEANHSFYGHGQILSAPEAKIVRLSEEHAVVKAEPGSFELGEKIEIIPVHVCTVVNLSNGFYVEKSNQKMEYWKVDARGLVW